MSLVDVHHDDEALYYAHAAAVVLIRLRLGRRAECLLMTPTGTQFG